MIAYANIYKIYMIIMYDNTNMYTKCHKLTVGNGQFIVYIVSLVFIWTCTLPVWPLMTDEIGAIWVGTFYSSSP